MVTGEARAGVSPGRSVPQSAPELAPRGTVIEICAIVSIAIARYGLASFADLTPQEHTSGNHEREIRNTHCRGVHGFLRQRLLEWRRRSRGSWSPNDRAG